MGATTSLLSFEEFEQLPETDQAWKEELLDGELIRLPPPVRKHMQICHRLRDTIKPGADRAAELGEVYIEMGYKFGRNTYLRPDVSIAHPDQPGEKYCEGAPRVAVEIISESNRASDVDRKIKKYLANGGQEVWVAYPKTRCVWVYRQDGAREFRGRLKSSLLPAVEIDLEAMFG